MNRAIAFASVFVIAMGAASSLLAAPASGTSRTGCKGPLMHGVCPPAGFLVSKATGCVSQLSCARDDGRGLSTAEMLYLHETVTVDAVPASAAAAWSSALGQTQSAMADSKVADDSRQSGIMRRAAPNSAPNTLSHRSPNES